MRDVSDFAIIDVHKPIKLLSGVLGRPRHVHSFGVLCLNGEVVSLRMSSSETILCSFHMAHWHVTS
jgi:hypothetical protein